LNWRKEAVNDLKNHQYRKEGLDNLEERIRLLDAQLTSLRGISVSEPVAGGVSKQEEAWINNISERERLEFSLKITKQLVDIVERGLASLDKREREVLEGLYVHRLRVEVLCEKMNFEKSRIYEIKDIALKKFTLSVYGTLET